MNEQAIQAKILKHLKSNGFVAIKTIATNRAGVPDILACSPTGMFWAIEVKTEKGKLSALQAHYIAQYRANNGIAFVCYGYDEYVKKFRLAQEIEANRTKLT